jgi:hypothetical protein
VVFLRRFISFECKRKRATIVLIWQRVKLQQCLQISSRFKRSSIVKCANPIVQIVVGNWALSRFWQEFISVYDLLIQFVFFLLPVRAHNIPLSPLHNSFFVIIKHSSLHSSPIPSHPQSHPLNLYHKISTSPLHCSNPYCHQTNKFVWLHPIFPYTPGSSLPYRIPSHFWPNDPGILGRGYDNSQRLVRGR